jgi:transposase
VDDVVLLHDNARPHVANRTAARLQPFGWEIMEHAPYSPDLTPSIIAAKKNRSKDFSIFPRTYTSLYQLCPIKENKITMSTAVDDGNISL